MTALHAHVLRGCAPRPLGAYLKALAVLRIVAEQKDPEARGHWQGEAFVLTTRLDEAALLSFFLHEWQPSPFVSPWNKGSGLLSDDPKGVGPLLASTAPRFALARRGLAQAKELTAAMERAVAEERAIKGEKTQIKDRATKERLAEDPIYKQRLKRAQKECKRLKDELQPECQRRFRGEALRWLRAAVVIGADGSASFPALLGTGGNDGKLDFTNNAMQRLGDLFDLASPAGTPKRAALPALRAALLGDTERGLMSGGIGQFSPAASGGANATVGALGDSLLNPWDLPLLLEGALLFAAGSSRRLGGAASDRTVAPFSARAGAAGYGSAALSDEGARGEQWMPLWSRPWTAAELAALLQEGRCQIGSRPSEAALDVARAIARLGVARGVTAFERYGFIERNGKSNYAVPLGRWSVQAAPGAALLDDLDRDDWWGRLRRAVRDERAPRSLVLLERRLADVVLAALAHGGEPGRWQAVLLALAELEGQLVDSGAFTASRRLQPLPRLSREWIRAADDGAAELRLALSLAGAGAGHRRDGRPEDGVRRHWLPLDRFGRFATRDRGLAQDPGTVLRGREAEADCVRLLGRRLLEGGGAHLLPLGARPGTGARTEDTMALLRGAVDLERALWLARALAALDWGTVTAADLPSRRTGQEAPVDPAWAVLRLCHLPGRLADGRLIPVDPAVLRLLSSGEPSRAFALTRQRLAAVGIRAPVRAVALSTSQARRLAASLVFPISLAAASRLARELDPQSSTQEHTHVS